jgi:hypothetical protein
MFNVLYMHDRSVCSHAHLASDVTCMIACLGQFGAPVGRAGRAGRAGLDGHGHEETVQKVYCELYLVVPSYHMNRRDLIVWSPPNFP